MKWNTDCRYKALGEIRMSPRGLILVFDLDEAIMFATEHKEYDCWDNENQYYILIDNAVDNPDVLREVRKIKEVSSKNNHVKVVSVHSFEFVLLSFELLEDWIFASQDELKEKRKDLLQWKNVFVSSYVNDENSDILTAVKEALNYAARYNSEQVSAKLLFDITRNTGFETDKGTLGEFRYLHRLL